MRYELYSPDAPEEDDVSLWRNRKKKPKPSSDIWTETRKNVEEKLGVDLDAVVQQAARGAAEKAVEMAVETVIRKMGTK